MLDEALAPRSFSIAIVGLGPRGLSVLERLLIRLRGTAADSGVMIWAIDPVEHGPGRVWRTTQPAWLMMNATAGEVTVRSRDSHLSGDGSPDPHSLSTWSNTAGAGGSELGPVDYPPRRVYGEYLKDVFERLRASAPPGVEVCPVLGEATRLTRSGGRLRLTVGPGERTLVADKVVLTTGHGRTEPSEDQRRLLRHARRHPACEYYWDGIAPDLPLERIRPGVSVAVRGLGLTFYDLIRSLSIGRGGEFARDLSGRLRYVRSGQEPLLVAGSRGGLPFRARPRMTEPPETAPHPTVFTEARLTGLRAEAAARRGSPQLDFAREVEPLIHAEAEHAYYACAARLGRADLPRLRLQELGRPFDGELFRSPWSFRRRLIEIMGHDVAESRKGTAASPLKAALEVLRQIRPLLPLAVDFGGLTPSSHRDFVTRFEPLSYILSAGPPDRDVEQLVALIESGVVEVVGPAARFLPDEATGGFVVESPRVTGSRRHAQVMIEARVPTNDINRSASPLIRGLLSDGMISPYVNSDASGDHFDTGGPAVTRAPFHVIDQRGKADPDIHALGVAVDGARWFTQVGTGRPGQDSPFSFDADAIARDVLSRRTASGTHH